MKGRADLYRLGLQTLPERMLVVGALKLGSGPLGLNPAQARKLTPLIEAAYVEMGKDPAFHALPSALPYGFSTVQPKRGHYFLVRPAKLAAEPTCIVFLHGWGGNFQWYAASMRKAFPDAVILLPSWGLSWVGGDPEYVRDMLADAERRLGVALVRPWLVGISAGGRGGFPIYNELDARFQGFVCLANAPTTKDANRLKRNLSILMLNGTKDQMVTEKAARKQARIVHRRVSKFRYRTIQDDHFFLLNQPKATAAIIQQFMRDVQK